jgi:hypothetical protein
MTLKITVKSMGGTHLKDAVLDAINLRLITGLVVEFEFNGADILICNDTQTATSICDQYDKWIKDKCPSSPRNIIS